MFNRLQRILDKRDKLHTGLEPIIIASLVGAAGAAASSAITSSMKPNIPKPPKQPDQIVGIESQAQTTTNLEEDQVGKTNARRTARKGAAAYRIPLQAKSTGVASSGGSGLNI